MEPGRDTEADAKLAEAEEVRAYQRRLQAAEVRQAPARWTRAPTQPRAAALPLTLTRPLDPSAHARRTTLSETRRSDSMLRSGVSAG